MRVSHYKSIIILLLIFVSAQKMHAQYAEYEYKAAFIFNFAKFIDWPDNEYLNNDTIVLGIYKNDPFGIILEKTMIGRQANGKYWKIVRLKSNKNLENCHIVFFSDIPPSEYIRMIEQYKDDAVLFIGNELVDFCEYGGNINFTPQYSEFQFEINNNASIHKGIKIDPKLLLLAKLISGNEGEF